MAFSLEELAVHCMEMIGYTGGGRSLVYEAVELMVVGEYRAVLKKIGGAEGHLSKAYETQFPKLMSVQAGREEIPCNMLLLHTVDILMTSTAKKDMVKTVARAKIRKGGGVREWADLWRKYVPRRCF